MRIHFLSLLPMVVLVGGAFFLSNRSLDANSEATTFSNDLKDLPEMSVVGAVAMQPQLHEQTRSILFEKSCARCHRSTLDSSKPDALAFFDLDDDSDQWFANIEGHWDGISNRVDGKDEFSEEEQKVILNFVAEQD